MLTSRAAAKYCSRNDGETFSTSATLSKPPDRSSRGSNASASTSRSSSSRMALAYSRRLSRCSTTEPGSGSAVRTWSSVASIEWMKAMRSSGEGCGSLDGGISAPRSLRTTSSHTSPSAATFCVSSTSSASSPAQSVELWQLLQYLSMKAQSFSCRDTDTWWPPDCAATAARREASSSVAARPRQDLFSNSFIYRDLPAGG